MKFGLRQEIPGYEEFERSLDIWNLLTLSRLYSVLITPRGRTGKFPEGAFEDMVRFRGACCSFLAVACPVVTQDAAPTWLLLSEHSCSSRD